MTVRLKSGLKTQWKINGWMQRKSKAGHEWLSRTE